MSGEKRGRRPRGSPERIIYMNDYATPEAQRATTRTYLRHFVRIHWSPSGRARDDTFIEGQMIDLIEFNGLWEIVLARYIPGGKDEHGNDRDWRYSGHYYNIPLHSVVAIRLWHPHSPPHGFQGRRPPGF